MSIRRKSTTHDLATLRLHPDGSRVQQSSVNTRRRTAGSTVIDSRGNWIAKDAGGKASVKKRRSFHTDNAGGEFINLSGDEENGENARRRSKGKQRARDGQLPEADKVEELHSERHNTRARQRLCFAQDLSFLDLPPASVSFLKQDDAVSAGEPGICFPDPASDLLKSIHHFASCYYRERGQLFDSSRNYRGKKKERYKQPQENVHTLASNTLERQSTDSESVHTETGDETEIMDAEDSGREEPRAKADTYRKDMYKAFDGSALMAIGIVLQEYVANTLSSKPSSQSLRRRRIG